MTRWFELWSLNLMVGDVRTRGNARLLAMTMALRDNRDNLVGLLETALTVHSQAEPLLYRGSYFVGISSEPDRNAFSAGLLKGRLLLNKTSTPWPTRCRPHRPALSPRLPGGTGDRRRRGNSGSG